MGKIWFYSIIKEHDTERQRERIKNSVSRTRQSTMRLFVLETTTQNDNYVRVEAGVENSSDPF